MGSSPDRRSTLLICLLLVASTSLLYRQVVDHDFVLYDDNEYVTQNARVQQGLTNESIVWAFTTSHAWNWHPLTWISHMLDVEVFGMNPSGHHVVNVILHCVNTLLLFLVLRRMTGEVWKSGFVAALFALHPLHVESVAWVAERKDVLSTMFWMLTMWAYLRYREKTSVGRYSVVGVFLALGLMAKPMLVTLPFVLLLLDFWPLGRLRWGRGKKIRGGFVTDVVEKAGKESSQTPKQHATSVATLVREKILLLLLSIAASVITFQIQEGGGGMMSTERLPVLTRVANALVSYAAYLKKMIWPKDLAVLYPHPGSYPIAEIILAIVILLGVSLLTLRWSKSSPYLLFGWLWYLGTLVPVIGLVQVGLQSMADRYTYVPLIGIFIMIAWGIPDLLSRLSFRRFLQPVLAVGILIGLTVVSWGQIGYWRESATLFQHTISVTEGNWLINNNLALALEKQGKTDDAIKYASEAVHLKPDYTKARVTLATLLARQGKNSEAIDQFNEALRLRRNNELAHTNLATILAAEGRDSAAIEHYREAIRLNPENWKNHYNLAALLQKDGKTEEAIKHFLETARINPQYAQAHHDLGTILAKEGKIVEAATHLAEALRLRPDDADAHNNLGVVLAQQGKVEEAIGHFSEAVRLNPADSEAQANLERARRIKRQGQPGSTQR